MYRHFINSDKRSSYTILDNVMFNLLFNNVSSNFTYFGISKLSVFDVKTVKIIKYMHHK